MDWDDLRIFLQVTRTRQLTHAAKELGVDDSTVGRRVARLEKQLGLRLLQRAGRRTVITEQGEKLAAAIEELESIVLRKIAGLGEDELLVAGKIRVGAPEGLGVGYLSRVLAELSAKNQQLETELVALPRTYSLASREVDIAITLERPAAGQVVAQKLTDYHLSLYGSAVYFKNHRRPKTVSDLKHHILTGYIPELQFTKELDAVNLGGTSRANPRIRSTSVIAQVNAVASGAAIGVLPGYLARSHKELRPILDQDLRITRSYWISVHDDLRHLQRVQTVLKAITARVRQDRSLFLQR
ncbi:LysR family transcriptional regulator [Microbacteriaceae bacterium K1510]|nr:LysR family transcriptional regulator [Microbacteriaceae bacterium K1510]